MKPPNFWNHAPDQPGLFGTLLAPLAAVSTYLGARRLAKTSSYKASVPVICIGNINIGGTGKTPTAIALASRLISDGYVVHIVSRGYGGSHNGPVRVLPTNHTAEIVGDEPLLLAAFAPTWVSKDRAHGVRAAELDGAEIIILDDGFQNPSVHKDLSIIVADARIGFGNGRVFPAGPLREPIERGLQRADIILVIGDDASQNNFADTWQRKISVPQVTGQLSPLETGMDWQGMRVLAFAGIGHPEKFFATLRSLGANIIEAVALDDHQKLSGTLMKRLDHQAKSLNAQLVTTEKDAVRLPAHFKSQVLTVPVRLQLASWDDVDKALRRAGIIPA